MPGRFPFSMAEVVRFRPRTARSSRSTGACSATTPSRPVAFAGSGSTGAIATTPMAVPSSGSRARIRPPSGSTRRCRWSCAAAGEHRRLLGMNVIVAPKRQRQGASGIKGAAWAKRFWPTPCCRWCPGAFHGQSFRSATRRNGGEDHCGCRRCIDGRECRRAAGPADCGLLIRGPPRDRLRRRAPSRRFFVSNEIAGIVDLMWRVRHRRVIEEPFESTELAGEVVATPTTDDAELLEEPADELEKVSRR